MIANLEKTQSKAQQNQQIEPSHYCTYVPPFQKYRIRPWYPAKVCFNSTHGSVDYVILKNFKIVVILDIRMKRF